MGGKNAALSWDKGFGGKDYTPFGSSESKLGWKNIWGSAGEEQDRLDKEKRDRNAKLEAYYNDLMSGKLPSSITDPLSEKYSKLAEQQGSYLAGQFGQSGMMGTSLYGNNALDLQKRIGEDYTKTLGGLVANRQSEGAAGLAGLASQPDESFRPGPNEVINLLGKVFG